MAGMECAQTVCGLIRLRLDAIVAGSVLGFGSRRAVFFVAWSNEVPYRRAGMSPTVFSPKSPTMPGGHLALVEAALGRERQFLAVLFFPPAGKIKRCKKIVHGSCHWLPLAIAGYRCG